MPACFDMDRTIAAIATAQAPAGIGVIRVSGSGAIETAQKVFSGGKALTGMRGYTASFGRIVWNGEVIDEAVALVFRAPHSYTGEDTVELSCHGGLYILQRVLRCLYEAGAAPAEPGEFTKRAFMNGKMDLTEAESVMQLIGAKGEQAMRTAQYVMDGAVARRIEGVKSVLLNISAHLAAWVDYPDEEIEELGEDELEAGLRECRQRLETMIREFDAGKVMREGIDTVIAGKPNVGKSTLMNLLSGSRRSIVTDVAGTTRDVVEETVLVGDVLLHLSDTAGIHDTDDVVEGVGVEMALDRLERAELIIAVFDSSSELSDDDIALLERIKGRRAIAVINKTDLKPSLDPSVIAEYLGDPVFISAESDGAYDIIAEKLKHISGLDELDPSAGVISTERQRMCCVKALESVREALDSLTGGYTLDAVNVCIDTAIDALLELTGERASESVVNEIFSKFCVGK